MVQHRAQVPAEGRSPAYEIVADLCRLVGNLCGADRVTVWVYDPLRDVVRPYASSAPDAVIARGSPLARIPLDDIPAFRAVLFDGEPLEVTDAVTDDRFPTDLAKEFAIASIRSEGLVTHEPVGVLNIEPASGALPVEARNILPTLASALSEAWARREAERQRATAELFLDLAASTADEASASSLLHEACRRLAIHLGVRRASIYLKDPDTGDIRPRMSAYADGKVEPEQFQTFRAAGPMAGLEAVLAQDSPVALGPDDIPEWWRETYDLGSLLLVPFRKPPSVAGVLSLDHPSHRRFTGDQIRLAAAVAMHVASITDRAHIAAQRDLELHTVETIRRLLEEAAQAASVEEAAEVLTRVAHDVLGAEHSLALLLDQEERIDHMVPVGIPPDLLALVHETVHQAKVTNAPIGAATIERREPVFVEDTSASDLLPADIYEPLGLRAYAAFPLLSQTRPLGVVVCAHTSGTRRWSHRDKHLAAQLALEGSLLVENALLREAERRRMTALSEEVSRLAELDRLRQVLFATVSHELRTPLTVISGVTRTLIDKEDELREEQRSTLLDRLDANAMSLQDIVLRLLDFTRVKEGSIEAQPVPTQLDEALHATVERLESIFTEHELAVSMEPVVVTVDPALIDRVIENLLTNTIRHTPAGTRVMLEARPAGKTEALVAVSDNGPGIPQEDLQHLGEVFFRGGHPDRRASRGLGLGLAFTREILRLHGSVLNVESTLGRGTRFSFRLPRTPEPA